MIKAVIFDCFGVLIADDLRMRINAVDRVKPESGRMLHDIMRAVDRQMITRAESIEQMAKIMRIDPEELLKSTEASLVKNTGLVAFVKTLKSKYKLALLSNVSGRDRLEELFDPGELDELFEVVVPSGDVGFIKPERQIYELTAQKLGVNPEDCIMIDDIREFCDGAEVVGMRSIQFMDNEQCKDDLMALIDSESEKY